MALNFVFSVGVDAAPMAAVGNVGKDDVVGMISVANSLGLVMTILALLL